MTYFNVGEIVNTHGIRGEVKVLATTDFAAERFAPGEILYVKQGSQKPVKLTVKSHRQHKQFDLLTFEEITNINEAEQYKGSQLQVTEQQQTPLEDGDYYYRQIIGLEVYSLEDELLGKISEVMETGANDVWVVRRPNGKEVLLPAIKDVIQKVDLDKQRVIVDWLEGLDEQ
ncbi:ribosome maturation factor RimM [Ligilactobacillus pabuli]|uniref:Ribosome maturation factor RimM n=1 Tax=Ligilactobacillus pabuli TaxID=2886039 RepID=A0ABQ5JFP2_9LACO|nr:ribosome maturation factor RimM [Ligilactobacillus pabuli]GKS80886.1 ribosome maturation factor RimM [Ligilactobacillus pabuli]HIW89578.1 ribosome maturation factor RimM [Candidatus Ligilactobacillus excrementipullorum]